MSNKTVQAYAVFDEVRGLIFETLAKTPSESVRLMTEANIMEAHEVASRSMASLLRVRLVKIEVQDVVDPPVKPAR